MESSDIPESVREGEIAMASSSKKPEEKNKKEEKSNSTAAKDTKKPIKKPEKKASTSKKADKSKPKPESKPDNNKKKSSNGTLVKSEVIADPSSRTESETHENENNTHKNVKPNNKRKRKEKVEENGEQEEAKVCRFPTNRIKRIIKSEDSRMAISQDVVFLVNKATEMFLEKFCEDGYKCSVKDRKKSLSYKHLSTVVHERKRYDFLSDYVPQKIKAEDALKEMNSAETGAG